MGCYSLSGCFQKPVHLKTFLFHKSMGKRSLNCPTGNWRMAFTIRHHKNSDSFLCSVKAIELSIINLRGDSGWVFRFSIAFMFWRIGAHDVQIDVSTGQGKIEFYRTTPLPGQMTQFHQDTSKWWIHYSNIFGIGMLLIAFTVMFIERGKNSF